MNKVRIGIIGVRQIGKIHLHNNLHKPVTAAELALKTMLIQEGIYLSDREGREVTVEKKRDASISTSSPLPG